MQAQDSELGCKRNKLNQPHPIVSNTGAIVEAFSALGRALFGFIKAAIASVNQCWPRTRKPDVKGTTVNQPHPVAPKIAAVAEASSALTVGVVDFLEATLARAKASGTDVTAPAWGDDLFSSLWNLLESSWSADHSKPDGMAANGQLLQNVTRLLRQDARWQPIYRSEYYFRSAKALTSVGALDQATEYFLWLDEEDETKKSVLPGNLVRRDSRYQILRKTFLDKKMQKTARDYHHDGITDPNHRSALLVRAIMAMPRRYVASRCQTGLWRVCFMEKFPGEILSMHACLKAVEELGVLCEGVARLFDGGSVSAVNNKKRMLGEMLKGGSPCAAAGFTSGARIFSPSEQSRDADSLQTLHDARTGDKPAMARVVNVSRNQAAHVTDSADWYLLPSVQLDVIKVQLDFVSALAKEFEATHGPLA